MDTNDMSIEARLTRLEHRQPRIEIEREIMEHDRVNEACLKYTEAYAKLGITRSVVNSTLQIQWDSEVDRYGDVVKAYHQLAIAVSKRP